MSQYPLIRCLVVVLKQFLIYHNLLESFNGGISSYCLILLILSYLQVMLHFYAILQRQKMQCKWPLLIVGCVSLHNIEGGALISRYLAIKLVASILETAGCSAQSCGWWSTLSDTCSAICIRKQRLHSSSASTLDALSTWLSTVGDRAFPVTMVRTWNSLPAKVTSSNSLQIFKTKLNSHLFSASFS